MLLNELGELPPQTVVVVVLVAVTVGTVLVAVTVVAEVVVAVRVYSNIFEKQLTLVSESALVIVSTDELRSARAIFKQLVAVVM